MFEQIKPVYRSRIVAMQIVAMMREGKLNVGEKIPAERELARIMNIGRNTLREAIASLRLLGLLEVRRGDGIYIGKIPSNENVGDEIQSVFKDNIDTSTAIDSRIAIEPGAAILASKNANKRDWSKLKSLIEAIVQAVNLREVDSYRRADNLFHKAIVEATHNYLLIKTLVPVLDTVRQPLWSMMKKGIYSDYVLIMVCEEHKAIYNALLERDEWNIFCAVKSHLEASKHRLVAEQEKELKISNFVQKEKSVCVK